MSLFLKGGIIGFLVAMPIGPIGILCIQRTLLRGQLVGIITGLGVSCADAVYGSISAFGLSYVYNFIEKQQLLIRLLEAVLLLSIGLKTVMTKEFDKVDIVEPGKLGDHRKTNYFSAFTSAFFITLTNPLTLFLFTGILSWLGIDIYQETSHNSYSLVLGIFTGSFLWFLFLSSIITTFKKKFSFIYLKWMNLVSGLSILVFGLLTLISIIFIKK